MTRRRIVIFKPQVRDVSEQAKAQPQASAPTARRTTSASTATILECLYSAYESQGILAHMDSNEMARRCSMSRDIVDDVAIELRKRKLISFDACDEGLMNVRLTVEGVQQVENPASNAEWHSCRADSATEKKHSPAR